MQSGSPHVLICGGGLVGLVLAQALKKHDISYAVYESNDETTSRQGWSITLHWSLPILKQVLPEDVFERLESTSVDPAAESDTGNFLVLDARNLKILYNIHSPKRRLRLNRQKLRNLLLEGLNVEFGKKLSSYTVGSDKVTAHFGDGKSADGSLLVGCDGNSSIVRNCLVGIENAALSLIGVLMYGVTQRMTLEQVAPLRSIDPLLFLAINPNEGTTMWHSIHNIIPAGSKDEEDIYEVQTMVNHLVKGSEDAIAKDASNLERLKEMKRIAADFSEPLSSTVMNIPETTKVICLSPADWTPEPWEGQGRVTLAGDAAGPMSMFRGEGANHGFLDAACLASVLVDVKKGKLTQAEALHAYETEVIKRRKLAIPLSRTAALDAHNGIPSSESPVIGARFPPPTSLRTFF